MKFSAYVAYAVWKTPGKDLAKWVTFGPYAFKTATEGNTFIEDKKHLLYDLAAQNGLSGKTWDQWDSYRSDSSYSGLSIYMPGQAGQPPVLLARCYWTRQELEYNPLELLATAAE